MATPTITIQNIETEKTIVFNTCHIKASDDNLLEKQSQESDTLIINSMEHGFQVFVHEDYCDKDFQVILKNALKEGFSQEFCKLMTIARNHRADWLKLDCDGSIYKELPEFNW